MKIPKHKVLLISPSFFGYRKYISSSLKKNSFSVFTLNDVLPLYTYFNFIRKKNVLVNSLSVLLSNYFYKFFYYIFKPSHLFVILGRDVTEDVINFYKSKNVKVIFYMWDSIANYPQALRLSVLADDFFSFDESDCKKYSARFVPLFYIDSIFHENGKQRNLNILFIGSVHSDRLRIVSRLLHVLTDLDVSMSFHLFLKSRFIFLKSKYVDHKDFYSFKYSDFSFKSKSLNEISEIYSKSYCVLDIQNANQSGYTIRTLEALASGCKLITTNSSILHSDLYTPERVLVIDRNIDYDVDKIISFISSKPIYDPDYERIVSNYSLKSWLNKIGLSGDI